jgi:hypothetical protein
MVFPATGYLKSRATEKMRVILQATISSKDGLKHLERLRMSATAELDSPFSSTLHKA